MMSKLKNHNVSNTSVVYNQYFLEFNCGIDELRNIYSNYLYIYHK